MEVFDSKMIIFLLHNITLFWSLSQTCRGEFVYWVLLLTVSAMPLHVGASDRCWNNPQSQQWLSFNSIAWCRKFQYVQLGKQSVQVMYSKELLHKFDLSLFTLWGKLNSFNQRQLVNMVKRQMETHFTVA